MMAQQSLSVGNPLPVSQMYLGPGGHLRWDPARLVRLSCMDQGSSRLFMALIAILRARDVWLEWKELLQPYIEFHPSHTSSQGSVERWELSNIKIIEEEITSGDAINDNNEQRRSPHGKFFLSPSWLPCGDVALPARLQPDISSNAVTNSSLDAIGDG
ncbi:predicted protein [Histoplasma capsulatum var. duboisii H88]|uniref:Predicted protein n=1 Tax=Ajellomyces capsulatus (strain H88) TaxID=544711 RepID=F0UN45_AJEC8|nr:predicted protein [Histoplasma capsulatum var. duboisii H88]